MKQIQAFLMANKVFLLGLAGSITVVVQQFVSQPTVDLKVVGYAVIMSVLSYISNQWRGQGVTITGILGTLAGTFVTVNQSGNFTWMHFFMLSVAAVLAAVAPPPKNQSYEKTTVIANAKQGVSSTEKPPTLQLPQKPSTDGK